MKKAIILTALTSLPLFSGQTAAVAPVPAPVAPATASPWEAELGASYNWAVPDIYRDWSPCKEVKSMGGDITAVYRVSGHSAFTLRFGYSWGGEKWANDVELPSSWDSPLANALGSSPFDRSVLEKYKDEIRKIYEKTKRKHPHTKPAALQANEAVTPVEDLGETANHAGIWSKTRIHTFNIMPGYRYTCGLTRDLSLYAGVNAGIANASNKLAMYMEGEHFLSAHDSAWGFAYSAELGFRYAVSPTVNVFSAYQFSGNTAMCRPRCEYGEVTAANRLHYHGIRAGLGFRF